MGKMIPYGKHEISEKDIDSVISVLKSDFLTQGPVVPEFERTVARYVGAKHGVAVNSATSALHIACLALDLGPGDWLWTSPITFVASANCGLYCGAQVDFVDIDPETCNLCPNALENKLAVAEITGKLPKIVVAVHFCGQPCDMKSIHKLSKKYGFKIIEDASHAIGSKYHSEFVGNCKYSDITVFSFHPVKIITTAEGGIALTNADDMAQRLALLRSHGITRNPCEMSCTPDGSWYYEQVGLGFNYRMTELQGALGMSQMGSLDYFVTKRRILAARYDEMLRILPITTPQQLFDTESSFHLYVIRLLDYSKRSQVFEILKSKGVGVNVHYIPVHLQPYYRSMGFSEGAFPEAERYYKQAITLPLYPTLSLMEQDRVVTELHLAIQQ